MAELLTISEVSKRSGVASSALRFYEGRGLIESERSGSGHRRYRRSVLRRIAFIVFAQRVGLSLEEIGAELDKLPPERVPTSRDWSRLSSGWSSRIDERIAELERLKAGLTECIGCGCLSLDRCQLANPNDRAAGSRARAALLDRRSAADVPALTGSARPGSAGPPGGVPRLGPLDARVIDEHRPQHLSSGAGPSRSWSCRDFRLSAASRIQASGRRCRYINRNVRLVSRQ